MRESKLDYVFLQIAEVLSERSSCSRKAVGCILAKDRRIITSGCNGPLTNTHDLDLDGKCFCTNLDKPCEDAIHAEFNAIAYAAKEGISLKNASLYTTLSPCIQCSYLIVQAGIKRVVFRELYRNMEGIEYLKKNEIKVLKL